MNWFSVLLLFLVLVGYQNFTKGQTVQRNATNTQNGTIVRQTNRTTSIPVPGRRSNSSSTTPVPSSTGSNDKVRIVGGVETAEHEFPFIVSLSKQGSHFCGATIIHKEWIITAAHCMLGKDFQIKAGEHNIENQEGTEQLVAPLEVFIYPKYNASTFENDIALVRVTPPLQLDGKNVIAFLLPSRKFLASGYATAAGWGTTSEGSHLTSPVLRKVSVPIVESIDCGKQYGGNFDMMTMLCAGESEGNKDSCQGDSGGPLICTHLVQRPGVSTLQNETLLCGIVSYGYGCARKGFAGVYTKVSAFMDWIEQHLYGEDFVKANQPKSTTPPSLTTKKTRKPFFGKPKSSVNNIHDNSAKQIIFNIFTLFMMFIVSEFVIVRL